MDTGDFMPEKLEYAKKAKRNKRKMTDQQRLTMRGKILGARD